MGYVCQAQENSTFIRPEVGIGFTTASNKKFPVRDLQKQLILNFGRETKDLNTEWQQWLHIPRTGFSLGVTDFGNPSELGYALSALAFLEVRSFNSDRWNLQLGLGGSYFNKKFDFQTNFDNRAVSTRINWSARVSLHYTIIQKPRVNYRLGLGAFHHSNGHLRLPNQGYNSFLLILAASLKKEEVSINNSIPLKPSRSISKYLTIRSGIGQSVLSDLGIFNNSKKVVNLSAEYGFVFNKSFKVGAGAFYQFYEQYYDYINDDNFLVRDGQEFSDLASNPWHNATSYGVFVKGELLFNHIGLEMRMGVNFHKPAYAIDWRLNYGWDYIPLEPPSYWVYGKLDSKYRTKKLINTRLGVKYYLKGTEDVPTHNFYAGAFINANLGQADFTELGLGYVYSFSKRNRK